MAYTCKQAILGLLAASGPQEHGGIKRECRIQATDYTPETMRLALNGLIESGEVVVEAPEEYGGEEIYGLPGDMEPVPEPN